MNYSEIIVAEFDKPLYPRGYLPSRQLLQVKHFQFFMKPNIFMSGFVKRER